MGGGAGVSVNGAYRIATERTMLAMPETGIGLFPDVGATRFLNLAPRNIGRYRALTGVAARAGRCALLWLCHAFRAARACAPAWSRRSAIWQARARRAQGRGRRSRVRRRSRRAPLALRRAAIDRCFAPDTVEAVLDALTVKPRRAAATRMGSADPRGAADEIADQPQARCAS